MDVALICLPYSESLYGASRDVDDHATHRSYEDTGRDWKGEVDFFEMEHS